MLVSTGMDETAFAMEISCGSDHWLVFACFRSERPARSVHCQETEWPGSQSVGTLLRHLATALRLSQAARRSCKLCMFTGVSLLPRRCLNLWRLAVRRRAGKVVWRLRRKERRTEAALALETACSLKRAPGPMLTGQPGPDSLVIKWRLLVQPGRTSTRKFLKSEATDRAQRDDVLSLTRDPFARLGNRLIVSWNLGLPRSSRRATAVRTGTLWRARILVSGVAQRSTQTLVLLVAVVGAFQASLACLPGSFYDWSWCGTGSVFDPALLRNLQTVVPLAVLCFVGS